MSKRTKKIKPEEYMNWDKTIVCKKANKGLEALSIIVENKGLNGIKACVETIETELKNQEAYIKTITDKNLELFNENQKQDEVLRIIKNHIAFRGGYIYLKGIPQSGDLYNQLKELLK